MFITVCCCDRASGSIPVQRNMESSIISTNRVSIPERITLKRAQVLTEMNETIRTLSCIESVLDEINRCIRPIDVDGSGRNESIPSSGGSLTKSLSNDTAVSATQKMQQLMVELEKWEDI